MTKESAKEYVNRLYRDSVLSQNVRVMLNVAIESVIETLYDDGGEIIKRESPAEGLGEI